jgi:hypothetical protein
LKRDIPAKISYLNKEKPISLLCYERVDVSNNGNILAKRERK